MPTGNKVAVLGWYGHDNLGDNLILEGLRSLFYGWQVMPMTNEQPSTYLTVDIKQINSCGLFVLGGGELISPDRLFVYNPTIPRLIRSGMKRARLNITSWIKKVKVPKIILGCGVEAETVGELTKSLIGELEQFEHIGLRDNKSVELLKQIPSLEDKVSLVYDLAYALQFNPKTYINKSKTAIVIPTDRQNSITRKSEKWLKKHLHPFKKTVFLPFGTQDNNDQLTCHWLAHHTNNPEIIQHNNLNTNNIADYIANCDKVFSYRLHGMILAHILGKPFKYYPYHRKLDRVYETIKNVSPNKIKQTQQQHIHSYLL